MNITVRSARHQDLDAIVGVHLRAFRGFFLTALGRRFVFELYRGFLRDVDGRLLIAEAEGRIAGFAAGTVAPGRFFRRLLASRWFAFGLAAAGAMIRRPHTVLPRLLTALRYDGEPPVGLPAAGLLSAIAVEPHLSGIGIGGMLLSAFCDEASRHGLRFVYLTTDRDDNVASNLFYQRHGFETESHIRRRNGRVLLRYVRALDRDGRVPRLA
jgi:ribosomal protein S18 acetylase RimI-like enzyme